MPPDPKQIFMAARSFHLAADILKDRYERTIKEGGWGQPGEDWVAWAVNSAFSTELYLKCLRHLCGNPPPKKKTHDFKILYDGLAQSYKTRLCSIYRGNGTADFEVDLFTTKDLFEKWRYAYEFGDGNIVFREGWTDMLPLTFYAFILEQRREWGPWEPPHNTPATSPVR